MIALIAGMAALLGWGLGAGLNWLAVLLPRAVSPEAAGPRPDRRRELGLQAAAAVCSAALWLRFGLQPLLAWAILATMVLLLIAAIDIDRRLVLNKILLFGAATALLKAAFVGIPALLSALLAGAVGVVLFGVLALAQRGALGAGDVKLAGMLGLMLAYPAVLTALFVGILTGGITAGVLLLTRRAQRRTMMPYAPFLSAGGIVTLLLLGRSA